MIAPPQSALTLAAAHTLLGANIIMPEQIAAALGVSYTSDQLTSLQTFPELWSEEQVARCRETHIFVPGAPLNLYQMRTQWPSIVRLDPNDWMYGCINAIGTDDHLSIRWYAVRKQIVEDSKDKTLWAAYCRLEETEEMLYACELIYVLLAAKLCREQVLFPNGIRLRCKEFFGMPPQVTVNFGNALVGQSKTGEIYLSHCFKDLTSYDVATTSQLRVKPKAGEGT